MIKRFLLVLAIFVSLFLEVTVLPFPFVLLLSLLFGFFYEDAMSLVIILLSSVLLDLFLLHSVGITGIFVFCSIIGYLVLEKIFSLQGFIPFSCVVFLSIVLYTYVLGYPFSALFLVLVGLVLVTVYLLERGKHKKGGMLA